MNSARTRFQARSRYNEDLAYLISALTSDMVVHASSIMTVYGSYPCMQLLISLLVQVSLSLVAVDVSAFRTCCLVRICVFLGCSWLRLYRSVACLSYSKVWKSCSITCLCIYLGFLCEMICVFSSLEKIYGLGF